MRVVCVDDEAPARSKVRRYVETLSDWQVVAEADDVASAVEVIESHQPDVLLLDIHLTSGSGFDVLKALKYKVPHLVFVTAYDQYAVKAFEYHALDYLLKPMQKARFQAMVAQIEAVAQVKKSHGLAAATINELQSLLQQQQDTGRVLVTVNDRTYLKDKTSLIYLQSEGNYLRLVFTDGDYLVRSTLKDFLLNLKQANFQQINRSVVVNTAAIKEIQTWFRGQRILIMNNGSKLKASQQFWQQLQL